MSEELIEQIYHFSKKCGINQVSMVTNHMKIVGELYHDENDDKKHEGFVTLTNAKVWRIEDICNCKEPDCKCDEATSLCTHDWLHVNVHKIIAFSLIK